jgi:hypothetical protein
VAEITYELSGTSDAFVVIGDEAESNYAIEGQITDTDGDGEVTVQFNSYLAGVPNSGNSSIAAGDVLSVSSDDEITSVRERGSFERSNLSEEALDTGAYELTAAAGTTGSETLDSVGTLQLEHRSVAGSQSWVAPQDADLTGGVGIYDRIGTNLTQADEIAEDDIVVHRLDASGIEGVLDYRTDVVGASNTTAAFNQSRGDVTLSVERRYDPPNADADSFRLNTSNMAVVEDVCDRVVMIADGRTVADDTVSALLAGANRDSVRVTSSDIDEAVVGMVRNRFDVRSVESVGNRTRVEVV